MRRKIILFTGWKLCLVLAAIVSFSANVQASSHREAPLIAFDPLADNTDVYAFRSPDDPNTITIIANYIPFEAPDGGPNYYTFGSNIRYEIHIKNRADTKIDDITYRFTFTQTNEDPTTFFNIRLNKQNLKTTYICQKSVNGGAFTQVAAGFVPPPNIGPRSIEGGVGLGRDYNRIMDSAIVTTTLGEKIFCGPVDDPFFVDIAGAFDVGNFRPANFEANPPKDGVARFNVHSIALKIPINVLQKDNKMVSQALNILDPDFVIGVWASASRQQVRTLTSAGATNYSGDWVQVSRLGMPLTNEVIVPLAMKDKWNAIASNSDGEGQFAPFFINPEVALYMDGSQFGGAVPSLNGLRIQSKSLGAFDFRNKKAGLFPVRGTPGVANTAFAEAPGGFADLLLPNDSSPRAADLLPIFLTGVPNVRPYQLATGKEGGNPLAAGKPFIHNFLPTIGDMLRLNMAVPPTPRMINGSPNPEFSTLGLVGAAALGLTQPRFNSTTLEFIPNMDGFPNGRRLEDDVTTIELQAVSGVVLAAIGLWYDDYTPGSSPSPVTASLGNVLGFTAGPTQNDTTFKASFPYQQTPWRGFDYTLKPRF